MEDSIGTLSIFTVVNLPDGREKRVTLANIVCEYAERKDKFAAFQMANPCFDKFVLGAKFTYTEWVSIY